MQIKTLALTGEHLDKNNPLVSNYPGLAVHHATLVAGSVRGNAKTEEVDMPSGALVELVYEDGGKWLGPSNMLEELYPGGTRSNRNGDEVFELLGDLEHPDTANRSFGKILLKLVTVFFPSDAKEKTKEKVKQLAGQFEQHLLATDFGSKGLLSVQGSMNLVKLEPVDTTKPVLLLLHGTGSSTQSSFEDLPGTELWRYLQETYGKNILAFQHETLTKSPLQNVADLLAQLPAGVTLHLMSHSRGGLVGEVLCRFAQQGTAAILGFSNKEKELLATANQQQDADSIDLLRRLANEKQYKVEKFVRVACPAAGTTILTKRLDYFVNILLNLLGTATGLAAHPAYMVLQELLVAVVDQKNHPDVLPGLEAMKPDSLFIKLLNNPSPESIPIAAPVAAISGNCKIGLQLKSLVVIASKLFYWEDNDLIVNTQSMYHGSKKTNGLQYFFDEGSKVDHFSYFRNGSKSSEAIQLAFKTNGAAAINGFTLFTESRYGEAERNAALGLSGVHFSMGPAVSGKKPIAIVLPGIMGSAIEQDGDLVWINYLSFLTGGLKRIDIAKEKINIPGIISSSYKDLAKNLSAEYDVVTFAYDWRNPLTTAAAAFDKTITELLRHNQPIKIIGHSMGGVLVRDFIVHHPETWKKLNDTKDFRLLFLGSPLQGSHRIVNVLFGEDGLIKQLNALDVPHGMKGLLRIFNRFTGLLGLLPLADEKNDFADLALWKKLANIYSDGNDWPLPSEGDLKAFAQYRADVLKAQPEIDFSKAIYIAGRNRQKHPTPCGYRIDKTANGEELVFEATYEGDESVTWSAGIPKKIIEQNNVYYVNVPHGDLANASSLFAGIKELLAKGQTNLFSRTRPVVRSSEKRLRQPDNYLPDLSPRGIENSLLGLTGSQAIASSELPVKIKVSHGDLKFADYPLLAGHFKNDSILYAEAAINRLLSGLLTERHSIGLYPGEIGTSEILLTQQPTGFAGAIIAGLGEPGTLNSFGLTRTVEQAVCRYLLMINGRDKIKSPLQHKTPLGLSSLIIGCGYGGLSIENSISAIVEGVLLANGKIKNLYQEDAKLIELLQFVELYEDRLLACYYTVHNLCQQEGGLMNITKERDGVEKLRGGRKRISLLQSEDWWNRIEVRKLTNTKNIATGMNFVLGGGNARQDERDVKTNTGIVEKLAKVISTDFNWDLAKARALYELLVPHDFKDAIKKYGNIVWLLDDYTAGFPWELLHDKTTGAKPLCVDSGMIRQLISQNGRIKMEMVNNRSALVVGDPNLKGYITQLKGAREEAQTVATLLEENGYQTKSLIYKSPEEIIPALFSADYKIIHLAGHGEFNDDPEKESGMVIGEKVFLTTAEIAQMSGTSELVFVNCCFLGQVDGHAEALFQQRYKLAANIGTQLINNGVKAVVAAGWAVDDAAALDFAKRFYKAMFEGYTFGDAVRQAREEVYKKHGDTNTWGAYQCYGDPFYRLYSDRDKQSSAKKGYVLAEQAEIDLANLLSDLGSYEPTDDTKWALEKLLAISNEVNECKLRNQAITEKEAFVYMELNMADEAVSKFEELQTFSDASYSFVAIEQYYNLKAKGLYQMADENKLTGAALIKDFEGVVKGLKALVDIRPTAERYSLLGSTYKKKMTKTSDVEAKLTEIQLAADCYWQAYTLCGDAASLYPFVNWLALTCLLVNAGAHQWDKELATDKKRPDGEKPNTIAEIEQLLKFYQNSLRKQGHSIDYFEAVQSANLKFCAWLLAKVQRNVKAPATKPIAKLYLETWERAADTDKANEVAHFKMLLSGAEAADKKALAKALIALLGEMGVEINNPL